ncbi:FHA domain-containing protein [Candidatus Darwinibacter acetoxidans]|jgi:pSer/pThr/pTyr-binding forkhead associated (FHA) protein
MAGLRAWLSRIIQVLTGKSQPLAEDTQETQKPFLEEDLAPTKRYAAISSKGVPQQSRAWLRLGNQAVPLQPGLLVGRGASCQLRLADPQASRVHASFAQVGTGWAVQDNASRNGTFLNGRRVERALLTDGDTIQIGQTVLIYEER